VTRRTLSHKLSKTDSELRLQGFTIIPNLMPMRVVGRFDMALAHWIH